MKTFLQLREAANRTKRNPTRDFLRRYPVSDAEMAKPVKTPEKKKEEKQGVAEVAFKDPSPMMKDSIKQDKIRSLKNLIAVAKVKGIHHKVKEYESELKKLKETTEVTEAGAFSYGAKPPRKGSVAYNALMKRKEQDKNRVKEIEAIGTKNHHVGVAKVTKAVAEGYTGRETKDGTWRVFKDGQAVAVAGPFKSRDEAHAWIKNHHVGVAKVTKEDIEDVAETYKYIDQSGGQVIKGKSGTYVGYTHSATKGKGANILKHNTTKKYYAAGGSSTAFTQKTTLHDTPQAAAKAYHKGNLAEQDEKEAQEYDYEGDMARSDLRSIIFNAQEVHDMLEPNTNLPEWVQAKITKAEDYMSSVRDYMKSENENIDENWKKKLAGAALAATMAVGAHARVSADHKDDPNINRLTGKPHVTQSDEKPAEHQKRELESADKVERHGGFEHGDKVTIHHNGKSYEGHFMDKDGPRMRGGKTIKVHHAQVGIRGLGHYEAQIHPSGHAAIYK